MKKADKRKVYEVYNKIIDWFDAHRSKDLSMEKFYLELIQSHFPNGGTVLDIGCGTGEPIAQFFIAMGYKLTGIDASEKMIERCKKRFPDSRWLLEDMRTLDIEEQFDIVIAWHSFFHLPQDEQRSTLKLFISLVKPNGLLVFTSGAEAGEVWGENGGYDLYHGSLAPEEYKSILETNNLQLLYHNIKDSICGDATVWLAQRYSK